MNLAVFCLLLTLCFSYEVQQGGVLALHDNDFPSILDKYPYILIKFYAAWCHHCQQLEPIFRDSARMLAEKNSPLKLAKMDATKQERTSNKYEVNAYPTLLFFINRTKVDFRGPRTRQGIVNWLQKKIMPVTGSVSSQQELSKLKNSGMVSLVLYSNTPEHIQYFKILATQDDHNKYYIARGELSDAYSYTTVEMHRRFGPVMTHEGLQGRFRWWVKKYSQPFVLDFNQRTVHMIFQEMANALLIFNVDGNGKLREVAEDVARDYEGDTIIVEVKPTHDDFHMFAHFMNVDTSESRIYGVDSKEQKKAVLFLPPSQVTYWDLWKFLESLDSKKAKLYKIDEDVKYDEMELLIPEEPLVQAQRPDGEEL